MTNTEERTAAQTPDPAAPPHPRATANRSTTPASDRFRTFIASGWAEHEEPLPGPREQASFAAARRERLSALHTGVRLIVPAGRLKQRANDTDYPFRAHSAFTWLTGWGSDSEPGAVLVLEPAESGHRTTLYFRERAGRTSDEFYANSEIGEFWIGPRPSLAQVASDLGLETRGIDELDAVLDSGDGVPVALLREADPLVAERLSAGNADELADRDGALERDIAELRLVKDAYEIAELRAAVEATGRGFEDVLADLPRIIAHERGERLIEGVFSGRARADGNAVGYDTIAAAGPHACILHWTRNDGPVRPGELVLLDAGVEQESYYTADITRTFPVTGHYSEAQRRVHETVLEAADAAFAIVRPGIRFREVHAAAMAVIAQRTAEWGLLPVSAEEALEADNQQHRRYMVHGTSHHLGLDVHDCAKARREMYLDGVVEEGMVFTIEPGLYFQPDDLTVPEDLRGIGVRIEDDVLVTANGAENLSASIPRTADDIEAWMARLAR
ncbi:aminopeptidase P family protein [Rathayibacter iranicus]|uniref:Xaa-Pro aminopeptidase n=3 Tax=Rathayibacter iranicus TaxID=59737 RepID=A0ABX5LDI8_9MICO|nr:aminopeptidase P family protein [Rathayibacter iranicus]MWV30370.1 M24 family metallopeptidase [Rathayibacter iranicus NCPPB 2253 = VKM Ac-1602]PPI63367.1 Xaa-Pro aminopeptidase [Rathayibacter iranicus]PWJ64279.1 Xaa-Pro aminopeptidase [Rathayibacter iranicus] [Rathayibacter iranicus NCPPB 2253 = VKM Ac-1602]